jgi:hypothetical protein
MKVKDRDFRGIYNGAICRELLELTVERISNEYKFLNDKSHNFVHFLEAIYQELQKTFIYENIKLYIRLIKRNMDLNLFKN